MTSDATNAPCAPNARLALYLTRSPLHIGTGQSLGDIDLPVARHPTTGHPCVPEPAQKRGLKDSLSPLLPPETVRALFGAEAGAPADGPDGPRGAATGMLAPQLGALLLLPVASGAGGCAWVTSPSVWQRFRRQAALAGIQAPPLPDLPGPDQACMAPDNALLLDIGTPEGTPWVLLGEAVLKPRQLPHAGADQQAARRAAWADWAGWVAATAFGADDADWQRMVASRLAVVADDILDGLLPQALINRARNKVEERAVQLWREEAVPEDTVFHALLTAQPVDQHRRVLASAQAALQAVDHHTGPGLQLQIGGNSSLGQGWVLLRTLATPAGSQEAHHG